MPQKGKLAPQQVLDVRALIKEGSFNKETIAKMMGVGPLVIYRIASGKFYSHIQTEEDLYKYHVTAIGTEKLEFRLPVRHKMHDTYCGFKISSLALRKYGRKNISALVDMVKICEHGELCEECCFIYSGPSYKFTKSDDPYYNRFRLLPNTVAAGYPLLLTVFFLEVAIGDFMGHTKMSCDNVYCVNINHITLYRLQNGRTRQEVTSDD